MPACEVRPYDVVRREARIDLEQDPPTSGPSATIVVVEWAAQKTAQRSLRTRMARKGRRRRRQHTGDNLRVRVLGQAQEIFPGRELVSRVHRSQRSAQVSFRPSR